MLENFQEHSAEICSNLAWTVALVWWLENVQFFSGPLCVFVVRSDVVDLQYMQVIFDSIIKRMEAVCQIFHTVLSNNNISWNHWNLELTSVGFYKTELICGFQLHRNCNLVFVLKNFQEHSAEIVALVWWLENVQFFSGPPCVIFSDWSIFDATDRLESCNAVSDVLSIRLNAAYNLRSSQIDSTAAANISQ